MKVKIISKKENYDKYRKMLEKAGFTIDEDANLVFKEEDYTPIHFVGKINDQYSIIPFDEVVYIESFGRDIFLYTETNHYQIKEKLYEIEGKYEEYGFVRINKSQIVNKSYIKKIKPLFNSKIKIILKTNQVLEISRTYLEHFRESIGF